MAYMQCPECKLTVPATATYLRGDQCPRCLTTMEPRDRFRVAALAGTRRAPVAARRRAARVGILRRIRGGRATLADRYAPTSPHSAHCCSPCSPSRRAATTRPPTRPPPTPDRGRHRGADRSADRGPDRGRRAGEPSEGDAGVKVTGKLGEKPTIEVPGRRPADRARHQGHQGGQGPEAAAGQTGQRPVRRRAVQGRHGVRRLVGPRRRAVRVRARPGQVIPGWDQGVVGMKDGGRRLLDHPARPGLRRPAARRPDPARTRRSSSSSTSRRSRSPLAVGASPAARTAPSRVPSSRPWSVSPVEVVVVDPVQAGAVHEAEPAAHRRAQHR